MIPTARAGRLHKIIPLLPSLRILQIIKVLHIALVPVALFHLQLRWAPDAGTPGQELHNVSSFIIIYVRLLVITIAALLLQETVGRFARRNIHMMTAAFATGMVTSGRIAVVFLAGITQRGIIAANAGGMAVNAANVDKGDEHIMVSVLQNHPAFDFSFHLVG